MSGKRFLGGASQSWCNVSWAVTLDAMDGQGCSAGPTRMGKASVASSAQLRDRHGLRPHAAQGWAEPNSTTSLLRGAIERSSRLRSRRPNQRAPVPTPPPLSSAARARATPAATGLRPTAASAGTRASLHILTLSISSVRTLSLHQAASVWFVNLRGDQSGSNFVFEMGA